MVVVHTSHLLSSALFFSFTQAYRELFRLQTQKRIRQHHRVRQVGTYQNRTRYLRLREERFR